MMTTDLFPFRKSFVRGGKIPEHVRRALIPQNCSGLHSQDCLKNRLEWSSTRLLGPKIPFITRRQMERYLFT